MSLSRRLLLVIAILLLGCNFVTGLPERLAGKPTGPGAEDPDAPPFEATVEGLPGGKRIDLEDPALALPGGPNSSIRSTFTYYGEAEDGSDLYLVEEVQEVITAVPEPGFYYLHAITRNGEPVSRSEKAWLDGVLYEVSDMAACAAADAPAMPEATLFPSDFLSNLTGKAELAETGYEMYGSMTDRYELSEANLRDTAGIAAVNGGNLYRAQDGGYAAMLEIFYEVGHDPNDPILAEFYGEDPVSVSFYYEQQYSQSDEIMAFIPWDCDAPVDDYGDEILPEEVDPADPVDPAGPEDPGFDTSSVREDIPILPADTVSDFYANEGMVLLATSMGLQETVDFYKAEMEARGWEFLSEFPSDNHNSLVYQKEGESATIEIDYYPDRSVTELVIFWVAQ